jgi:hypothetical protein
MRTACSLVLLCLLAGPVQADAETQAQTIAPYVNSQTFAVARFDLSRPDAEELVIMLGGIGPPAIGPLAFSPLEDLRHFVAALRKLEVNEIYALYSFDHLKESPVFLLPIAPKTHQKELAALLATTRTFTERHAEQVGTAFVFGPKQAVQHYRKLKALARPELTKAFAATGDRTVQFVLVPSGDVKRAFEEIVPTLPAELGGGPITFLTRGVQWLALGMDGPPKSGLTGVIQATDEPAAGKVHQWMSGALKKMGGLPEVAKIWPKFDVIAAALQPTLAGDRLLLKLDQQQMAAVMEPLVGKGRQNALSMKSQKNLLAIALAMHAFADTSKGTFPTPATYDKQGKPLLSWRVQLLPYLDEAPLYKEFHHDEPWDSPHNLKLVAKMPAVYRHPDHKGLAEGKTPYLVPVGKDTIFPGGKGIGFRDITDGTSNTILVVEAADDLMTIWTKPDDWQINLKEPHRGLVSKGRDGFAVAMADGSVQTLPATIAADRLNALLTRNGGD